jgi:hypothetical protein
MDELARKYVETRDKKIVEELYDLAQGACEHGQVRKVLRGRAQRSGLRRSRFHFGLSPALHFQITLKLHGSSSLISSLLNR